MLNIRTTVIIDSSFLSVCSHRCGGNGLFLSRGMKKHECVHIRTSMKRPPAGALATWHQHVLPCDSIQGSTAAGSLVSTNIVPLFPLPMRISSSTKVVSSQPKSLLCRTTAKMANKKLRFRVKPLSSISWHVSKDTIARLDTWVDFRKPPATQTRPQSKATSLITRLAAISKICFTTRSDVSTSIPAADTDPFALKLLFCRDLGSSFLVDSGFHASGNWSASPI